MAILTVSRKSCVHLVGQSEEGWTSDEIKFIDRDTELASKGVHTLIPIPAFSAYLVGRQRSVDLVDLDSSATIHTFTTEPMQPRSLKHIAHAKAQPTGLLSLTLAYVSAETGELIVQTHLSDNEDAIIYAHSPDHPQPWTAGRTETRRIPNPGTWEALSNGSIIGVRQRPASPHTTPDSSPFRRSSQDPGTCSETWEAWVLSHLDNGTGGDFETRSLHGMQGGKNNPPQVSTDHLMIAALGPMVRLGTMSVAVGYGDAIKIVSAGHEYFDDVARDQRLGLGVGGVGGGSVRGLAARRRKAGGARGARGG